MQGDSKSWYRTGWVFAVVLGSICLSGHAETQVVTQHTLSECINCHAAEKLPAFAVPADNPLTDARTELGRWLFYEPDLSVNRQISCASCHQQQRAFSDGRIRAIGATGSKTRHNAPALSNAAWLERLTWADPRITTLEQQMALPLFGTHPVEMGVNTGNQPVILARLSVQPYYQRLFAAAFPGEAAPFRFDNVIRAIAAFERRLVSVNAPYDEYRRGRYAITMQAYRGLNLFFGSKAGCSRCHDTFTLDRPRRPPGESLTDNARYHALGLPMSAQGKPDRGLAEVTGKAEDIGRFRIPSLRNVAVTAPYMHDGSIPTLRQVLAFYGRGKPHGSAAGKIPRSPLLNVARLARQEQRDLLAFLHTLTDRAFLRNPALADPHRQMSGRLPEVSADQSSPPSRPPSAIPPSREP